MYRACRDENILNEEEFKNPGKIYRPSPFWSWNDKLEEEELRWQVREFADKGFGGYFMHARIGLATEYLSDEWMNCIMACLDEGKKVNLESWLYDEDRWPSGFAGGKVPAKGDNYRIRFLSMKKVKAEDIRELLADPSVQAIYEIQFSSGRITSYRRITKAEQIEGKGRLLAFKAEIDRQPSRWFNEETYVDLLNLEVTE